jgi:hypothetical protein
VKLKFKDLFKAFAGKASVTSVTAKKTSVAVNGPNSAPITINDMDTIVEAVKKSNATQYAVISGGVLGSLHTEFDRQIDVYREQMYAGAVKLALQALEKLLADQKDNLSDVLKFRVKANIAICHLHLGDLVKAPRLLLDACTYASDDPRAIANKTLAYILQDNLDEALSFGERELTKDPNNELLASFMLQATRIKYQHEQEYSDPFPLFSERVKLSQTVRIAHIHLLSSRRIEGWRAEAQRFLDEYPDDSQAKNLIAVGILHHYVENRQSENGFTFSQGDLKDLRLATEYIEIDWNEFKLSDRVAQASDLQNIQNLLILYKLANNIDSLVSECSYVLEKLQADQEIISTIAKSLIDLQENELFNKAIKQISDPTVALKLKFQKKIATKDWLNLSKIEDYSINQFDEELATHAKIVIFIARAYTGQARGREQLSRLLERYELDSRGRLLLFDYATASKITSIALMAHQYGHDRVDKNSETIEFFHYMKLVRFLMLWKEIVSRLEFHPLIKDNYELRHMLALGFLNEYPLRSEAIVFFERYVIPNPDGFDLMLGVFYFKRNDFLKAIPLIRRYLDKGGDDLFAFIVLCDIAKLNNDKESLTLLFDTYDALSLEGNPEQRMHVEKVRASIGFGSEALSQAYAILVDNPNSAPVALGYFSIFLMANTHEILSSTTTIGENCFYKLSSSEGDSYEKKVDPNTDNILSLNPGNVDYFTRHVWGKSVGQTFIQEKMQGTVTWTVDTISHHFLHAYQEICKNYETRFPDAGGLWTLKIDNDNIQPLLDILQKQTEKDDVLFGEIIEKHIPLEIAAGLNKTTIFDLRDLIISRGNMITTCAGTKEERLKAMQLMESYEGRPAVLDSYTAKVAADLGILASMKKFFGSIIISHATIQALQLKAAQKVDFPSPETLGRTDFISAIEQLQSSCEIVEFNFPRSSDDLTERLIEINTSGISPYFIAKDRGGLFISDDAYSREFAAHIYDVKDSTWLQSVVNILAWRKLINREKYTYIVLGLAERKHNFVSVGSILLEETYQRDDTQNLSKLATLCVFLGGPAAELESHYQIILKFILAHWLLDYNHNFDIALEHLLLISHGDAYPSTKVKKATSILLDRLILIPGGRAKLAVLADLPVLRLESFIHGWWKGHFYTN